MEGEKKAAVMAYFSVTIDVSDSINAGRWKYLLMNCKSHEIKKTPRQQWILHTHKLYIRLVMRD